MTVRAKLALCLLLSTGAACASDDPRVLAGQMIDLLRYDEQFGQYRQQCLKSLDAGSPDVLVGKNPDYYSGLRPGHPQYQGEVARLMRMK